MSAPNSSSSDWNSGRQFNSPLVQQPWEQNANSNTSTSAFGSTQYTSNSGQWTTSDKDARAIANPPPNTTTKVELFNKTYDQKTGRVAVKGDVDFSDPKLRVHSITGSYDIDGAANFDRANFQLMDRNGRGFAKDIDVLPSGTVKLEGVRYTSCPVGNDDWMLQASSISLDTKVQEGVAHNVTMRFKDVPIFYTPYISFPLGDERKSGVLFPSFGHSGSNGFDAQVPYYLNLAPNYDLTLTPGVLTARGVELSRTSAI